VNSKFPTNEINELKESSLRLVHQLQQLIHTALFSYHVYGLEFISSKAKDQSKTRNFASGCLSDNVTHRKSLEWMVIQALLVKQDCTREENLFPLSCHHYEMQSASDWR